jgi:YihY family inner membrane protein
MGHIGFVAGVFPPGSFDLILNQLTALTQQKTSTLSFAFVTGLVIAIWSANSGMKALFDAMNVAYQEDEKRSLVRLNLLSLAFTFGALVIAIILIAAIGILPAALAYLWLDRWQELLARFARWPFILIFVGCGNAVIYRYGPSREQAKLRWLSWGVVFSTALWLAASVMFSFYIDNFANYNATDGTLGALMGMMVWVWISSSAQRSMQSWSVRPFVIQRLDRQSRWASAARLSPTQSGRQRTEIEDEQSSLIGHRLQSLVLRQMDDFRREAQYNLRLHAQYHARKRQWCETAAEPLRWMRRFTAKASMQL